MATSIDTRKLYEIYTLNPETGENGWYIHWVLTASDITQYPNFDVVITVNDGYAGMPEIIQWEAE